MNPDCELEGGGWSFPSPVRTAHRFQILSEEELEVHRLQEALQLLLSSESLVSCPHNRLADIPHSTIEDKWYNVEVQVRSRNTSMSHDVVVDHQLHSNSG